MNQRWHDSESTSRPRQIQGSELEDEFDRTRANGRRDKLFFPRERLERNIALHTQKVQDVSE